MSNTDRYIDDKWKKPRVAKGTPLYRYSSIVAAGIVAVFGFILYSIEQVPGADEAKRAIIEGKKFALPESVKYHIESMKYAREDPQYHTLITNLQKKRFDKEREEKGETIFDEMRKLPEV